MLISAVCPRCRTTYHVQDNLRGKAMRCQVTTCRHIFVIDDTPPATPVPPAAAAPERPQQTGQVGDLVPLIPVEDVAPEPPTPVTGVGDLIELVPAEPAEPLPIALDPVDPLPVVQAWEDGPPPARRRNGPPKAKEPAPPAEDKPPKSSPRIKKPAAEPEPGPRVIEAGDWSAPPVRRGANGADADDVPKPSREAVTVAPPVAEAPPADQPEHPPAYDDAHRPPTHWAKWVVIPFVLLAFGGLGYGVFLVVQATRQTEERVAKEADTFFADHQFRSAAERYGQLLDRYPESEQTDRYRFRRDLSELRNRMTEASEEIGELLDHYEQFVKERQKDPLLPEDAADLGAALVKLLTDFADRAAATPTDDKPLETLKRAATVVAAAKAIRLPKGAAAPPWEQVDAAFGRVRAAIARMNERRELMAELERVAQKPSYASIVAFERLVRDREKAFPNLSGTPEVTKLLNGMYERHLQSVRYVEAAAPKKPVRRGEDEPALLLDPLIQGAALPGDRDNGVVLALVRGLLYGLERTSGKVRWAVRVGIDTTTLPVRVPARAGSEERILALSSDDPPTLTALDTSGHELWRHRLGAPVLGRPVVVDQRAYLATYSGEVHEIELIEGRLLGRYLLGQPLTAGGTPEPGSRRVYFPADDGCVYVLDVAARRCDAVLYTRHPAGSLRSELAIIPPGGADAPGYLVLTQANGLDGVRLRVWDLPVQDGRRAAERALKPPVELSGWTAFTPYHDPEKMVLLSDAGVLGLFGIRQPNNRDQPLFPLLRGAGLSLDSLLRDGPARGPLPRGRAEVVEVQGNDLWVLAGGRLQRLRLGWGQAIGPELVPVWGEAAPVGAPVHAAQRVPLPDGRTQLVVVTRPEDRSCHWVSCFDDEHGRLLWRRQLGLVVRGEPVPLLVGDGPPRWLLQDQAGSLYQVDPAAVKADAQARWVAPGDAVFLAGPVGDSTAGPLLLSGADQRSVYALTTPGEKELVVRQVKAGGEGGKLQVVEGRVPLAQPVAGSPALVGSELVVPLADGSLARVPVPLAKDAQLEAGPTWRADRAAADARCHVVAASGERFVTSDGGRGLTVWEWKPGSTTWDVLPANREEGPGLELRERVVELVRLPDQPGEPVRLLVADSSGTVSLVQVLNTGALKVRTSWDLGGPITAPPFVRATAGGLRVGCVVDRSRLAWLDPAAAKVQWYETPGADPIVGAPQLAGDRLIVADQSGLTVALDAATGKPAGDGHQLRGSVAPVATPVPLSNNVLLAPLSDGTLQLLPLARLIKGTASARRAAVSPAR